VNVAFIGLGNMGAPMAGHLVDAGHDVAVYDLATDRVDALAERGARAATSPADAASGAEVVSVTVMNGAQVDAVCLGDGGALASMDPGAVLAIHSTVHPRTVQGVDDAAPAGVDVLDAPISGGVPGARGATLCVMCGGDADAFERARPAFLTFGSLILHLGPLGAGLAAKLARNLMGYVSMLGAQEGRRLAEAGDVDLDVLRQILDHTGAVSPMMRSMLDVPGGDAIYSANLQPLIDLAAKDMEVTLELAADLGLDLPASVTTLEHIDEMFGPGAKP
jgi:3-hydroxyisobutyrate dehydrogenase-like beta-hydroxyacid dehydrogenase